MADFFSDVFDSFTGQQAVPQQTIIPTNELFSQAGALLPQLAGSEVAYNQALAPGLTDVRLGVSNQLDPSILGNLRGANKSILDQLNLGSALGQELQEDVIRNALEDVSRSGWAGRNLSEGGTGLVARDLGLTGLDLLRRRQQDALAAGTSGSQLAMNLFQPRQPFGSTPGNMLAEDIGNVQAAMDDLANIQENIRRQNFSSLLNTGGRIMGMVAGGIIGSGNPMAIEAGGNIGGSLFQGSGVAGYGKQQKKSSSGFGDILNFGGGGGGGSPVSTPGINPNSGSNSALGGGVWQQSFAM